MKRIAKVAPTVAIDAASNPLKTRARPLMLSLLINRMVTAIPWITTKAKTPAVAPLIRGDCGSARPANAPPSR